MVLWSCASHIVQDENIAVPIMAQLGFQSDTESSGKSTALEIVKTLAYRGQLRSSYTAATIFRFIHERQTTFALSELHNVLTPYNQDMRAIINACHRRSEAFVDRVETLPDGSRKPKSFRCWAALAWGAIGALNAEVESRSIILPVQRALPEESKRLRHSAPERSKVLNDVRRQFAAWSRTVSELPDPALPDYMHGRLADNWRVLFQIAECAGGAWPKKVREAAEFLHEREPHLSETGKLLASIRRAFGGVADPEAFIGTHDLIEKLKEDEAVDYGIANDRRPIDEYWLRKHLRPVISPARSERADYRDEDGRRITRRGYRLRQFADAFLRFLPLSSEKSDASDASDEASKKARKTAEFSSSDSKTGSDAASGGRADPTQEKARETACSEGVVVGSSDASDISDPSEQIFQKDGFHSTPPPAEPGNGLDSKLKAHLRSKARKPNGVEREPELEIGSPPVGKYELGLIDAEIRRLRSENPKRSIAWIAKQVGQPRSRVQATLEGAP